MKLSVLIPCHRRLDLLHRALASVQDWPVLVVDDSVDGLDLGDVPSCRTEGQVGFAAAVNLGLEQLEAQGYSHVLLLNDDAVPAPGCVDALARAWSAQDGALAPMLVEPTGQISSGFVVRRTGRIRVRPGAVLEPTPVDAVSGAAMLIRASERLDAHYRHGFEDLDLCRRLKIRGLSIRTLPIRCEHTGGGTVSRSSRLAQAAALSGHLRYIGGGWRSGFAVALSLGQVLREGASPSRLLGVLDGCRDHRRRAHCSAAAPDS
jgi:GT2 family glycosyltransferase